MTTLPATDTIDGAELRRLLAEDPEVRVLDVRTGGEFETVHIPGSFNVPLDTLGEHVDDLADVEHPVVLVCQSGGRATQAHGKLTTAGKERLHILEGGMAAWQAGGGAVVRGGDERWSLERQVRLVAGAVVLGQHPPQHPGATAQVAGRGARRRPHVRRPHRQLRDGRGPRQAALQPRPGLRHRRRPRRHLPDRELTCRPGTLPDETGRPPSRSIPHRV